MVERNLISEGFIRNTATSIDNPTFSGSQIVNEKQQSFLVDGDFLNPAVTVSATQNINLTADLGARWKLKRIEVHTDAPSSNTISIEVSNNGVEFYPLPVTGSPNLYTGILPEITLSGAPRFIRYKQEAPVDINVFELSAINDDGIVDFGPSGFQTEAEIKDAPIGNTSAQIEEVKLFNRFDKSGVASVFIENSPTAASEFLEIAVNSNGPWFGRPLIESLQPDNTPFELGNLENTRIIKSTGYSVNFVENPSNMYGWESDNGSLVSSTAQGVKIQSNNSLEPRFSNFGLYTGTQDDDLGGEISTAGVGNYVLHQNHIALRPDWYNKIRVRLVGPSIIPDNFTEGPRLYWRGFDSPDTLNWLEEESILSDGFFNTFTGEVQDFIFDVGSLPSWTEAGVIRGLAFQPFVSISGIDVDVLVQEIEVFHSSRKDRVVLDFMPVISGAQGQRPPIQTTDSQNASSALRFIIPLTTRVTQPCLITKVIASFISQNADPSLFLGKFDTSNPNFTFPLGSPSSENFIIKNMVKTTGDIFNNDATFQFYVRWKAEPGDFIGWSLRNSSSSIAGIINFSDIPEAGNLSAYTNNSTNFSFNNSNPQQIQSVINSLDNNWVAENNRFYHIWFEGLSAGDYVLQGSYRTPIFDGKLIPALLSSSFLALETSDSSIDSKALEFSKTIKVRASDIPPKFNPDLGTAEIGLLPFNNNFPPPWWQFGNSLADPNIRFSMPVLLNEEETQQTEWQINFPNGFVSSRQNLSTTVIQNVGASLMYNPEVDELWILNVLLSGTAPNNLRPIWDVYSPEDFNYLRTQHVTEEITYSYNSNSANSTNLPEVFEPVGFIYDDSRQEIYIISRVNSFFINTVTYNALVLNSQGQFLRLSYRNDLVGGNINFLRETISVAFDGTYFYHLTSSFSGNADGTIIAIYKRGSSADPTSITFIDSRSISQINGFEFLTDSNPTAKQIIYNPIDGLLYIMYANRIDSAEDADFRTHEIHAIKINFDTSGQVIDSIEKITLEGIENNILTGGVLVRSLDTIRDGFLMREGLDLHNAFLRARDFQHGEGWTYNKNKDMYVYLQTREARWGDAYNARLNVRIPTTNLYTEKSHSFLLGFAADSVFKQESSPTFAVPSDPVWGTLSGTLSFETKTSESILFPPGRYAQIEYVLNASSDLKTTPQLISSQLNQGILVGDVPASGTKSIFLRTNIPEEQTIGDLQTSLKVFWEISE